MSYVNYVMTCICNIFLNDWWHPYKKNQYRSLTFGEGQNTLGVEGKETIVPLNHETLFLRLLALVNLDLLLSMKMKAFVIVKFCYICSDQLFNVLINQKLHNRSTMENQLILIISGIILRKAAELTPAQNTQL